MVFQAWMEEKRNEMKEERPSHIWKKQNTSSVINRSRLNFVGHYVLSNMTNVCL